MNKSSSSNSEFTVKTHDDETFSQSDEMMQAYVDTKCITTNVNVYLCGMEVCLPQKGSTTYNFEVHSGMERDLWKQRDVKFTAEKDKFTKKILLDKPFLLEAGKEYAVRCLVNGQWDLTRYVFEKNKEEYNDGTISIKFHQGAYANVISSLILRYP
jgi:hypothetical protein